MRKLWWLGALAALPCVSAAWGQKVETKGPVTYRSGAVRVYANPGADRKGPVTYRNPGVTVRGVPKALLVPPNTPLGKAAAKELKDLASKVGSSTPGRKVVTQAERVRMLRQFNKDLQRYRQLNMQPPQRPY